jgi:hypothetical protein
VQLLDYFLSIEALTSTKGVEDKRIFWDIFLEIQHISIVCPVVLVLLPFYAHRNMCESIGSLLP